MQVNSSKGCNRVLMLKDGEKITNDHKFQDRNTIYVVGEKAFWYENDILTPHDIDSSKKIDLLKLIKPDTSVGRDNVNFKEITLLCGYTPSKPAAKDETLPDPVISDSKNNSQTLWSSNLTWQLLKQEEKSRTEISETGLAGTDEQTVPSVSVAGLFRKGSDKAQLESLEVKFDSQYDQSYTRQKTGY